MVGQTEEYLHNSLKNAILENMRQLKSLGTGISQLWNTAGATDTFIGMELDGLALRQGRLDDAMQHNLLLMQQAEPVSDVAVVASARNEGPYLVEWIAHNLIVGFDQIFIYTNDNTDGSLELLRELEKYGFVHLIESEVSDGASPQIKAYEHSIHLLRKLRKYKWVAYFDLDEFIVPDEIHKYSIKLMVERASSNEDVHSAKNHSGPDVILINWDWYGSGHQVEYNNEMVQKRFNIRKDYGTIKSICKLSSISRMDDIHIPDRHLKFVNARGEITSSSGWATPTVDYRDCRLNHYFHKSLFEYAIKKERGTGLRLLDENPRTFDNWFQWEPIKGINATELGTPPQIIARVESKMKEIRAVGAITRLEQNCISEHKRVAENIFGSDWQEMVRKMREHAEQN